MNEIERNTIVKATRTKDGFSYQAKYYAKCGDKHAVDFNGTNAMLVDEVEVLSTLSKKEAKQIISQMFSKGRTPTSSMIREVIDLIQ
jgi:hypothetical protein